MLNISESVTDVMHTFESNVEEYLKRLDKLKAKTKSKIDKKEVLKLEEQVTQTEKEMHSLDDLVYHVHIAFASLYSFLKLRISVEVRKLLIWLAYTISAILIMSLIFLALSGMEFFGAELFSNFERVNMAIILVVGFMGTLLLLFQILNLHFRIISR